MGGKSSKSSGKKLPETKKHSKKQNQMRRVTIDEVSPDDTQETIIAHMGLISQCDIGSLAAFGPIIQELAAANLQFGLDVYKKLSSELNDPNLLLSPFYISAALAMALLGVRGDTPTRTRDTLKLKDLGDEVHTYLKEYLSLLRKRPKDIFFSSASRLLVGNRCKLLDQYLEEANEYYRAICVLSNSDNNTIAEVKAITEWVKSATENRIRHPISNIDPDTALMLVNTIYFKGIWTKRFLQLKTTKDVFTEKPGCEEPVDMMHLQDEFMFLHSSELKCSILELPYADEDVVMLILLPNEADGLGDLEQNLSKDVFDDVIKQMEREMVLVTLPKFSLQLSINLDSVLPALGMIDAFECTKSDLSGIDGTRLLYISQILHKAFLEINEEGCEAATATATRMRLFSLPLIQTFKADHPFMFLIRDRRTNMDLFLGRLAKIPR